MKSIWKWFAIIGVTLLIISVVIVLKVYSDVKNTVQEVYTPLSKETSVKREQAIEVASKEAFSLLILGVDEREGDGGRSDTLMVMTVNPITETTKIVSLPRDTYTEMIGLHIKDKINHAYAYGGIEMTVKTVEHLLNIPIHYVVKINMEGFKEMIEVVGGITVDNPFEFYYEGEYFPMGEITLDAELALKYSRMRYEDPAGDFGRQNRQKQVIEALIKKGLTLNNLLNYSSMFRTIEKHVEMNMLFEDLLIIQKDYRNSFKTLEHLYLNNGTGKMMDGIYYYIPDENELEEVKKILGDHLEIT